MNGQHGGNYYGVTKEGNTTNAIIGLSLLFMIAVLLVYLGWAIGVIVG
jgi:hypothetical protein